MAAWDHPGNISAKCPTMGQLSCAKPWAAIYLLMCRWVVKKRKKWYFCLQSPEPGVRVGTKGSCSGELGGAWGHSSVSHGTHRGHIDIVVI